MSERDQLLKIFTVVGTPNEQSWPGISEFPMSVPRSPTYASGNFPEDLYRVGPSAVDLLRQMLTSNPIDRISAAQALQHPFFAD